jgi:hypothetical protein
MTTKAKDNVMQFLKAMVDKHPEGAIIRLYSLDAFNEYCIWAGENNVIVNIKIETFNENDMNVTRFGVIIRHLKIKGITTIRKRKANMKIFNMKEIKDHFKN